MKKILVSLLFLGLSAIVFAQENPYQKIDFIIGDWSGTGSGFGNTTSTIVSGFHYVMDSMYIEVKNESWFEPTEKNPDGEHHVDRGFISYDQSRGLIVFRQFNSEGYVNQYVLNEAASNRNFLVFDTEAIENFVPGGKARWTINKLGENEIETIFDVSFGNEYSCFGRNALRRK